MAFSFHTLDVFTSERFNGNPLAVVLDAEALTGEQMQRVAREFNLSETVFVLPPEDRANTARLRIFTPARELPFAGHPTIGSAILLAGRLGSEAREVRLEEGVGLVRVDVETREGLGHAVLSAAVMPAPAGDAPDVADIAAAIALMPQDIGFDGHAPAVFEAGNAFLFVPVASRQALARAACDLSAWARLGDAAKVGVFLYCRGEADIDWHARLFAPDAGIMEDPATGSAAATLPGPLAAAEALHDGTHRWVIAQGEDMGRPSRIDLEADLSGGTITGVRVGGHAVKVMSGTLQL